MKDRRVPKITKLWPALTMVLILLCFAGVSRADGTLDKQLREAAGRGDITLVQTLLDKGAKVNAKGTCGRTALMEAAWAGNLGLAKLLLERGANVNAAAKYGKTALMMAVEMRHADVTKLLLEKGADVNAKQTDGWTAARTAALWGDVNELKLLKDHGAQETLCMAAMLGDTKKVEQLLAAEANINSKERDGRTALMEAAREGNVEVAKVLLDHGADLNSADSHGKTALMEAVMTRHPDMVKLLVDMGVNVDAKHKNQWTALTLAVSTGQSEIVRLLLGKGADPNTGRNKLRRTALMEAVVSKQPNAVKVLLDKGADVNAKDELGGTALMLAASTGQEEMVKLLLEKGADVNAESEDGSRPLDCALRDKPKIRQLLEEHGAKRAPSTTIRFSPYSREEAAGGTFQPKTRNQNIRLNSEEAVIRLKRTGYTVYAVFHFVNNAESATEWVGFRKLWRLWRSAASFVWFDAWVDGRKMEVSEEVGPLTCFLDNPKTVPWLGMGVTFPAHSMVTIRIKYEADYSYSGPSLWYGEYDSVTDSCQKEAVEKFSCAIDGTEIGGTDRFDLNKNDFSDFDSREVGTKNMVKYEIEGYKPQWTRFRFKLRITPGSRERIGYSEKLFPLTIDGWPR